ncbi:GGDEF domain-containing response regulator [Pseudomonas sp. EpS/L25]|uniref:GGDEF domain-containing response regulator n=1 Tax=Pseudomonas sp. EpS/L25 TaxID=1749078 RepID=UPI00074381D8|nr:diguanylate cyclase [Pseudomonas sp. EpS/L25]KUM43487.1 diguanylate cyclase response regulator [Pseudomonas sp. EpS/L25]
MATHEGGALDNLTAPKVRLLLVDDQLIIIEAVRRMIADQPDIELHYCLDAHQAVNMALQLKPTVVLQDLIMPEIDGLETVRRFRADPTLRDVPIVVLSSKEDPQVKAQSFATGANDYLVKLPDKLELLARVRYHSEAYVLRAQRDEAFRFLRESQRQLAEANIQLQKLVAIDSLTGINNRRHFDQTYEGEWLRARRSRQPLALLLCDVDHFKRYNDTYGHLSGDLCLKKVAAVLTEQLKRPADLVARYGGEEFAMVLPDTDAEGARKVAEACRAGVERLQVAHSGSEIGVVTISIGVGSIQPQSGDDHEAFLERTDQALYQAKASGRNRVELLAGPAGDA